MIGTIKTMAQNKFQPKKSEEMDYVEEPWTLIGSYFKNKHLQQLVRHQLESYNEFITTQLPKTIDMFNPIHIVSEQDYMEQYDKYRLEIDINLKNLSMYRPEIHENNGATKLMFPNNARLRNFTYACNLNVDMEIEYTIRKGENLEKEEKIKRVLPKIHLGKFPIMLKSSLCVLNQYKHMCAEKTNECFMDPGGYFIINGQEKTCLGQEKAADNKIYCYKNKKDDKYIATAEIRCVPDWKVISPKQIYMMVASKIVSSGHEVFIQVPRIKKEIPIVILFRALGVISDRDICEKIVLDIEDDQNQKILDYISGSLIQSANVTSQEDAIRYITNYVIYTPINMDKNSGQKKKREFAIDVLENDLFPHCASVDEKVYILGYMVNKLVKCCMGYTKEDDRDSYVNKRIETTGVLLNNLVRNYLNKLVRDAVKQIVREINNGSWKSKEDYTNIINMTNIYKIIKTSTIENGIKRALATGDFGIKMMNSNKVGVAQVLNRLTYASSLSHLRRINNPIDKGGKLVPPRKLHGSSWGFLCPSETPEGQSIGIVKNLSYMTCISIQSDSSICNEYVKPYVKPISLDNKSIEYNDKVKVFINCRWVGITEKAMDLYKDLKFKKRSGILNIYTSVSFDYQNKEIHVFTDGGRLVRPLMIVNNNELVMSKDIIDKVDNNELLWSDLFIDHKIKNSALEYIDCEEQSREMICMTPKNLNKSNYRYTLCEIHPSTMYGVLASCIPFPEHNQSPRNTYQCAMGKQAMGLYVTNFRERMDKTAYLLNYGMRPLVDTRLMGMLNLHNMPSGNQVIVAIMTHSGFNQEDSILINEGSINRGLFQATIYHTEKDEDKKTNGDEEIRKKPDKTKTKNIKFGNYEKINKDGVMDENELIEDKDIIISKVVVIKQNKNDDTKVIKYEDQSKIYRTNEKSYVDRNYIDRNGDGYKFCKVRIRATRQPVIGDKLSSRHGQKGTIGNIIPEQDMPFTEEGLRPDIIINPHAIPSRMTIAQLKETVLGKLLLNLGLYGDGSSFGNMSLKSISNRFKDIGYESKGNEILYNGMTGEQIETAVFIGPAFYQRLKHMVNDKQHSRSVGPMVNLTRQPAEGRSRDGGLRVGEMERDVIIAHGASKFVKDRLYDASDKYSVHVCKKCGMIACYNDKEKIYLCNICDNKSSFAKVNIPYSAKLLFQELISMNVVPRILTE